MAFVRVASTDEIEAGHGRLIEHGGVTLVIFNAGGGRFHACGAVCPHEDGPLSEGWLEGDVIVCPWHGFDFELGTGRCRVDANLAIPVYPVRVQDDGVEVDVP